MKRVPVALTIAGSDSGGGAGIEADLKTFGAFGVYGAAVITSVTAQNTQRVSGIHDIPPEMVGDQIDTVLEDIEVDAAKTGMLSNREMIDVVCERMDRYGIKVVVDPVMVTKSGDQLIQDDAVEMYREEMVPKALVLTPNLREAEKLTGMSIAEDELEDMKRAAEDLHGMGAENVVIKGAAVEEEVIDILFDGEDFLELTGKKFYSNKHGTGCTFSSAITANISKGLSMKRSVEVAKDFVGDAIEQGLDIGKGERPVNHMVWNGRSN